MKKLLLSLFTLLFSCSAWAYDKYIDGIYYYLDNATQEATVTNGNENSYSGDVIIPSSVTTRQKVTYTVTSIGDNAFSGCTGLTSVTIGSSVTSIGGYAFYGCTGLASVTIGNSVTSIGHYAFHYCTGLTSIEIPNSVTNIGSYAFSSCTGLTSIEIPNSVTSIGDRVFSKCTGLTSIEIPNSVTSIGDWAFFDCKSLTSINIPNNVTSIGERTFYGCTDLSSIEIPNSVTSIGEYACYGCTSLTSIEIPNSVTSIGSFAFSGCTGLTSIEIPESVTSIGSGVFSNTKWYENQPDGLVYAGKVAYKYKGMMPENTSINIKNGTIGIANSAFSGCTGLTSIEIPNSLTSIGDRVFYECTGLTSIEIPNSVTSIGESAFEGCKSLTSIEIPNSVTSIGDWAFFDCKSLTSIEIPNSVTSIGHYAFSGCTGLTSIEIPNSVTSIGESAFEGCTSLTSITCETTIPPTLGSNVFKNVKKYACILYVPEESLNGYKNADQWKDFITIKSIPICIDGIYYNLNLNTKEAEVSSGVMNCSGSVYIPSAITYSSEYYNVTSIGSYAFYNRSGLTSIEIPNSVTSIGDYAFCGCTSLTSATIGNSVTGIGSYAFYNCSGLASVEIPNSVTNIGSYSFSSCTGLTTVTIGNSVTSIGVSALPYSTSIYVNEGTTTLLTLWNYEYYEYTPYAKGTSTQLEKPIISVEHIGPTNATLKIRPFYSSYSNSINEDVIKTYLYELNDLLPETSYNYTLKISKRTKTYSCSISVTTPSVILTTLQPRVASSGNVVVAATSNIEDMEANVGFEWRRTDWTDDFISKKGEAYIYDGTVEGYIRNLNTEKLWKVRPYYTANNGKTYYGEWVGLDPTDTSYFIPTVHTYDNADVEQNTAMIKGYMMRGSDNVTQQGFKYWKKSKLLTAPKSSIPADAITVNASGNIMEAELSELEYGTEYGYASFVSTSEGETFYGEVRSFTTGEDITGIEELSEEDSDEEPANIIAIYNMNGQLLPTPQKGMNIVKKANGQTIKIFVK